MIPLAIVLATFAVFGTGLWAALRHQQKFNEQQKQLQAGLGPRPFDPDAELLMGAKRASDNYLVDPGQVVEVTEQQLRDNPVAWNERTIVVVATWHHRFEDSRIAGAWVRCVGPTPPAHGAHRVRASGLWLFPRAPGSTKNMPGFGHLGMSWGEFRVFALEAA